VIQKVSPVSDRLTTAAGSGDTYPLGDGGPATAASVESCITTFDHAGNLVVVNDGSRVRVVANSTATFYGQNMTAGDIYTIAGDGNWGFSGDGGPATSAELDDPAGVAVDGAGNVLIADTVNDRVRVVAASTGTFYGQNMTAGDIYTVAGDGLRGISGDGGPGTAAELDGPGDVTVTPAGDLLIADFYSNRVRALAG
jgi:hypothetical protein